MTGKTHAIIGANAIWLLPFLGILDWRVIPLAVVGALGGLVPDIDAKESDIQAETLGITKIFHINHFFGHRRFFHSFMAAGLSFFLLRHYAPPVLPALGEVFALGYLSHEVIDGFNLKGVCYFYPINWHVNLVPHFMQTHCGSWVDHGLFVLGTMSLGAFIYAHGATVLASAMALLG